MKLNMKKSLILSAAFAALSLPLYAEPVSGQNGQYNNDQNTSNSRQMPESTRANVSSDCGVSKVLNAKVRSTDNQELGKVQDVIINPQTGKIDFVVLGKSGVLGIGQALGINAAGQAIPVPWQATTLQSDGSVTVNLDKSKLQSAPSISKDYSNLNQPGYVAMVFDFYGISNNSNNDNNRGVENSDNSQNNTGAAESPSGTGNGTFRGTNGWNNNINNNR